jgi:hypothetical protein
MIQDAESFGFVENVSNTMKFMKRPNESLNWLETMKHGYKS